MSSREAPQTSGRGEFKLQPRAEARPSRGNAATSPGGRSPRELPEARRAGVGLGPPGRRGRKAAGCGVQSRDQRLVPALLERCPWRSRTEPRRHEPARLRPFIRSGQLLKTGIISGWVSSGPWENLGLVKEGCPGTKLTAWVPGTVTVGWVYFFKPVISSTINSLSGRERGTGGGGRGGTVRAGVGAGVPLSGS